MRDENGDDWIGHDTVAPALALGGRAHPRGKLQLALETAELGFTGEFSVNWVVPELLGQGKSVSWGFGAVGRAE